MNINTQTFSKLAIILFSLLVMISSSSCQPTTSAYIYTQPALLDDGLVIGDAQDAGINIDTLGQAVDHIRAGKYGEIHSVLIYKDGGLVFEEYFPGHRYEWEGENFHGEWVEWDAQERHKTMSVGKSYTSAIVGIAIEEGYINSVQDPIWDYLPDHQQYASEGREAITVEHLVAMNSGLEWMEWGTSYGDENNYVIKLWLECSDQIACILERPLAAEPGTRFNYSGGDMILLGEIVRNATGMSIDDFGAMHLFEPLGIDSPEWSRFKGGVVDASGSFRQTPREMLKFGVTYLNGGLWEDQQIIPEEWVEKSFTAYNNNVGINVPGISSSGEGYGYTWYIHTSEHRGELLTSYYALGWGDQEIFVIPDLETVVVFTGGNYAVKPTTFTIFDKLFLPAIE